MTSFILPLLKSCLHLFGKLVNYPLGCTSRKLTYPQPLPHLALLSRSRWCSFSRLNGTCVASFSGKWFHHVNSHITCFICLASIHSQQELDMSSPMIFATSGCFVISAISHQPENRHLQGFTHVLLLFHHPRNHSSRDIIFGLAIWSTFLLPGKMLGSACSMSVWWWFDGDLTWK